MARGSPRSSGLSVLQARGENSAIVRLLEGARVSAGRSRTRTRIAKLVLQLGTEGAVMLNGNPCPYHLHTCPLAASEVATPGDTLLAVTTLASAQGADDRTSLRRGVAAATGQVAGLELPTSFHELDAA